MVRSVIIDDEEKNVKILRHLIITYCQGVQVVGDANDAVKAEALIRLESPDLVFLDIEMPKGNAFDLLNKLVPFNFEVIFVTAFDEHAIKAFRYSALDYLLKPVNIEELKIAVSKAIRRIGEKSVNRRLEEFLRHSTPGQDTNRIALSTNDGLIFYDINEIVCCTAEGSYTRFDFTGNKQLLVTGTLKDYEERLPEKTFCRVHNSYLINLNHVRRYYRGRGGYVEMDNGSQIEVSARKKDEFLAKFRH